MPIWSPTLTVGEARWRRLAHELSHRAGIEDSADGLGASDLARMLMPKRQLGFAASLPSILGVVEETASDLPRVSTLLATAMGAAMVLLRLGNAGQRKSWLGQVIERGRLPLLLKNRDVVCAGEAFFNAVPDAGGWIVRGKGFIAAAPTPADGMVAFALIPQEHDRQALTAFVLPGDTAGISVDSADGGESRQQCVNLDVRLSQDMLLGAAGSAQAVFEEIQALCRIAAAAQAIGAALTAYEQACRAVRATSTAPAQETLKLASCASALCAARTMLHESVRAVEAGENVGLLSAMTMLSSAQCCDQMIATSLQIAGTKPLKDFARLHALLHARQIHLATAGPAHAQAALLAGAITPLETNNPGVPRTMSHKPGAHNSGVSSDRVVEILDAAADAFTQQSYDATTLDYIGDVIGVTKGSIYYHYRSKADLFVAVYRRAMEMNIDTVAPISGQPGVSAVECLYRMVYAHALQVMKHLSYQRVAVQDLEAHLMGRVTEEQRIRLNEVIALRDRYEQLFVRALQKAIDAGELPQQSARMAVKPLFGAINHTTMWYRQRPGETAADRDRIASYLATFVVSGLQHTYQPFPVQALEDATH
ncbi:MAG: TetR family transcriptional regulator [Betaproteobacteria bacterium]|nr:TetR family transcriptional regulator [Betaproteobacteria bacterium]